MYHYITWFQNNYPELHNALIACDHNYNYMHLNPYHLESDCWSHTMMVCKIAEIQGYDKVVQIVALLHDIGKPTVRGINTRNNHIRFFDHEIVSSYLAIDVLNKMYDEEMITLDEMSDIHILIAYHGELYRNTDPRSIYEKFKFDERLYLLLKQVSYCDNLGRFSPDLRTDDTETIKKVTEYFNQNTEVLEECETLPCVELLCGISQNRKVQYLNDLPENIIIIDSEDHKDKFFKALSEEKNIVVDLPNLTVESRKSWLCNLPEKYSSKAKIFLDAPAGINIATVNFFVYPLYDEVDLYCFQG